MSGSNAAHSAVKVSSLHKRKYTQSQEKKIGEDEFMAAAIGDVEWLKQSIRGNRGAVNYDKNGLTPLHLAAIHGRLECLKLMIEKLKVDINLPSKTGWRPIHLVISNQTGKRAHNCLCYLLEKGANPSVANDDGITPVHQAASEGHVQCLKALIEAGASAKGIDYRGHTPIDLAKLWGHRKCARLLAAEQWHQDKRLLAKEMSQLHKLRMQKTLHEIQADEENKTHKQLNGDMAFKEWLEMHGLEPKPTGPELSEKEAAEGIDLNRSEQKANAIKGESLYMPNSVRQLDYATRQKQILIKEKTGFDIRRSNDVHLKDKSPEKERENTRSDMRAQEAVTDRLTQREMSPQSKNFLHVLDWNKSTKANQRPYVPILEDFYPRDEYSMLPKPPLKRQSKSPGNQPNNESKVSSERQDGRPVIYKCKHIADVHKKKHFDLERLPHSEVGMHLSMDPNTRLFQAGLLIPLGTGYSWQPHSGLQSNSFRLQYVMDAIERMNSSSQCFSTEDPDYDIHDMYMNEVM